MAVINQPPNVKVDTDSGVASGWVTFFSDAFAILSGLTQSGTTANRPTARLWVGRMYFDTTLGKPIWYSGSAWVDATGAAV